MIRQNKRKRIVCSRSDSPVRSQSTIWTTANVFSICPWHMIYSNLILNSKYKECIWKCCLQKGHWFVACATCAISQKKTKVIAAFFTPSWLTTSYPAVRSLTDTKWHIYAPVNKYLNSSDNGLSPDWHKANVKTNAPILSIKPQWT